MAQGQITGRTIFKLAVWSLIVGFLLYSFDVSPGDFYGWLADVLARFWNWVMESGLQYMLVGATIVVPVFIFSVLRKRSKE